MNDCGLRGSQARLSRNDVCKNFSAHSLGLADGLHKKNA
jgi:hypothetical protein